MGQAMHNIFPEGEITGDEHLTLVCESEEKIGELIWDTQIRESARSVLLRGGYRHETRYTISRQAAMHVTNTVSE